MSELAVRLRDDLNTSRRERDKLRTLVLGTTLAELKNREIELGRAATDAEVLEVLGRAIKKRREAAEQIRAVGRPDAAEKAEQEAQMLLTYMPAQMAEDDVRKLVRDAVAAGASNMGAVMAAIMPHIKGRFDGKEANRIVREELG
jgi:uncharacterized protein YqeY